MKKDKKDNTKKGLDGIDLLCYMGIIILFLLIIIPPVFRILVPKEEVAPEPEPVKYIANLVCDKIEDKENYSLKTNIKSIYDDGKLINSNFVYEVSSLDEEETELDINVEEYDEFMKIANIDGEHTGNLYTIKIDYAKFDYADEELLKPHRNFVDEQKAYYEENGFTCSIEQ